MALTISTLARLVLFLEGVGSVFLLLNNTWVMAHFFVAVSFEVPAILLKPFSSCAQCARSMLDDLVPY